MSDGSDLDMLRENSARRQARWLIWTESLVILGLLVGLSLEYENNIDLQSWLRGVVGPLGFMLNGTLVGLYAGVLIGYAFALLVRRRSEREEALESIRKKKI